MAIVYLLDGVGRTAGGACRPISAFSWCLLVVTDDFRDDEVQEFLREFRVEVGLARQPFEPLDLLRLARGVRGGQVVLGLEPAHRLGVLEPLGQRVDEDRVEPVDRLAVVLEKRGGAAIGRRSRRIR
jgi:hypothetical protein